MKTHVSTGLGAHTKTEVKCKGQQKPQQRDNTTRDTMNNRRRERESEGRREVNVTNSKTEFKSIPKEAYKRASRSLERHEKPPKAPKKCTKWRHGRSI